MYRPSPQIPKPSPKAANICFESSTHIINLSHQQMQKGGVDITWVFLLTLNMSINTILWAISYPEVRRGHPREEVEELVHKSLDALDRCAERWPGTSATSQLYAIFSKACLQSYDAKNNDGPASAGSGISLPEIVETQASPHLPMPQGAQVPYLDPPQFGYVFDSPPEAMETHLFDPSFPPPQLSFRSNSIFNNPATTDNHGRRFSYFPPDLMNPSDVPPTGFPPSDPVVSMGQSSANFATPITESLPSPPDSMTMSAALSNANVSPDMATTLATMPNISASTGGPLSVGLSMPQNSVSPPQQQSYIGQPSPNQGMPDMGFSRPTQTMQTMAQQKPLPNVTSMADWFTPQPNFASQYAYGPGGPGNADFFGNVGPQSSNNMDNFATGAGLGLQNLGGAQMVYNQGRQGSLTQSQQVELLDLLEKDGLGDMDAFLNSRGNNGMNVNMYN